jgi:hypothetical protein
VTTPDRARDRRRLAEAMGWREGQEHPLCKDMHGKGFHIPEPDPWADDAAAWRLAKWLHSRRIIVSAGFVGDLALVELCHEDSCDPVFGEGIDINAALCAAAIAWLDAKQTEAPHA